MGESAKHRCYICKAEFEKFLPYRDGAASFHPMGAELKTVGSDIKNFYCPACRSIDRERHLAMYFDKLNLWNAFIDTRVLHFAPERVFKTIIPQLKPKEYVQADLNPSGPEVRAIDVTNIDFPDEYFDFIMCNHVLEHVPDDARAISELFRVLKKDCYAVLQTPYSKLLANSFCDPNINTDELRQKFYGQEDHVRLYGQDLFKKLEQGGFEVTLMKHRVLFEENDSSYFGVNPEEDLILVHKPE